MIRGYQSILVPSFIILPISPSENFSTYGRFKVYLALLPHLTANMRAAQWLLGPHRYFISP